MNPTGYEKVVEHLYAEDIYGASEDLEVYHDRMKRAVIEYNTINGTTHDPQEAVLQYLESIGIDD